MSHKGDVLAINEEPIAQISSDSFAALVVDVLGRSGSSEC